MKLKLSKVGYRGIQGTLGARIVACPTLVLQDPQRCGTYCSG